MTKFDPAGRTSMVLSPRDDSLSCSVSSDWSSRSSEDADEDTPVVQPFVDHDSRMTAWCEAAAANA